MARDEIPAKLQKIARAKEQRARMSRSKAAREVRETHEALETLEDEHTAAERRLLDAPPLDGEALALLGVGRQVHLEHRQLTEEELSAREAALRERSQDHLGRLQDRHGKDKLFERERRRRRADFERRMQREMDDLTSSRRGRE